MTPERLADLRRRVADRRGWVEAALVAELLAAYDEAVPTREGAEALVRFMVVEQQLRGLAADELERGMISVAEARADLDVALDSPNTRAKCSSLRTAINSMATALRHLSKAHAFEVAADEMASTFEDGVQQ